MFNCVSRYLVYERFLGLVKYNLKTLFVSIQQTGSCSSKSQLTIPYWKGFGRYTYRQSLGLNKHGRRVAFLNGVNHEVCF